MSIICGALAWLVAHEQREAQPAPAAEIPKGGGVWGDGRECVRVRICTCNLYIYVYIYTTPIYMCVCI